LVGWATAQHFLVAVTDIKKIQPTTTETDFCDTAKVMAPAGNTRRLEPPPAGNYTRLEAPAFVTAWLHSWCSTYHFIVSFMPVSKSYSGAQPSSSRSFLESTA